MTNLIYAIDPGPSQSALVVVGSTGSVSGHIWDNGELISALATVGVAVPVGAHLVIEEVASYGMPVGEEVFSTVFWTGRFAEGWRRTYGLRASWSMMRRSTVKMHLCHTMRATDATIRQALIDRYGPGKPKAIGTKAAPGPLYGLKADLWAALALAVTYADTRKVESVTVNG